MKKIIFTAAILFSCLTVKVAEAQVSFNLGINIGSQPEWGPVGYDHADYYYMPDIDTYYSVPTHQYVYYQNNTWIHSRSLPSRYSNYDLYHGHKVVINEPNPWLRNNVYRTRYASYKGRRDQVIIRDSREPKYKEHWDNGKHKGWDKGHGNEGHGNKGGGHGNEGHGNGHGNEDHGNKGGGHGHGRD